MAEIPYVKSYDEAGVLVQEFLNSREIQDNKEQAEKLEEARAKLIFLLGNQSPATDAIRGMLSRYDIDYMSSDPGSGAKIEDFFEIGQDGKSRPKIAAAFKRYEHLRRYQGAGDVRYVLVGFDDMPGGGLSPEIVELNPPEDYLDEATLLTQIFGLLKVDSAKES